MYSPLKTLMLWIPYYKSMPNKKNKRSKKLQKPKLLRMVRMPAAYATESKSPFPRGATRVIRKVDFVGEINGTTAFSLGRFAINPGLSTTFPWLAIQAAGWQFYRVRKMQAQFISRVPTTKSGTIFMFPEYSSSDNSPDNAASALNNADCKDGGIIRNLYMDFNPKSMHLTNPWKLIRDAPVASSLEKYDAAALIVGSWGIDAADDGNPIGQLKLSYEIELASPQAAAGTASAPHGSAFLKRANTAQANGTPIATQFVANPATDGIGVQHLGAGDYRLPKGSYKVEFGGNAICDTNGTVCRHDRSIRKNGLDLDYASSPATAQVANGTMGHSVAHSHVTSDGLSDVFQFLTTLWGAAGVLTTVGDFVKLAVL